jgi:hypothetical protein
MNKVSKMQSKDHNKCPKAIKMAVEALKMKTKPITTVSKTAIQLLVPEIRGRRQGAKPFIFAAPLQGSRAC